MHVYICPLSQYKFGPVYANYFFVGLVNCGSQSLLMFVYFIGNCQLIGAMLRLLDCVLWSYILALIGAFNLPLVWTLETL